MSFYIQNASTGLVLDVKESQRTHSAPVVMFPYHGGPNQLWIYQNNMIYSKLNNMVLNVRSATGEVITYPCHNGDPQKWYFDPDSTIRNANGKVLDVNEGGRGPGTKLIVFQKHGGENQRFNMVPVSAPTHNVAVTVPPSRPRNVRNNWARVSSANAFRCEYNTTNTCNNADKTPFYIQNASTGLVLDIKESQRTHSAPVVMFPYHGGPNQLWTYQNNMIYSQLNGMVLDVSGSTGHLITFPAHGMFNQKWYFDPDSTVRSGNGKVLDVEGAKTGASCRLITFPRHGGPNQKFCKVSTGQHVCPGHALPPGCSAKGSR